MSIRKQTVAFSKVSSVKQPDQSRSDKQARSRLARILGHLLAWEWWQMRVSSITTRKTLEHSDK